MLIPFQIVANNKFNQLFAREFYALHQARRYIRVSLFFFARSGRMIPEKTQKVCTKITCFGREIQSGLHQNTKKNT